MKSVISRIRATSKSAAATILMAASANVCALVPLGFEAVTQTDLPQKSGLPVSLIAATSDGNCKFYGETREQPKIGFFNELLNRHDYFVDITKVNCGDTVMTVKPITAIYDAPLKAGDKVKLPYIDFVISQTISSIESFYNNIEIKCEADSVWYTLKSANVPMQIPLWVDGKTIGCRNDSYIVGDKTITKDDVMKLIFKDMESQSKKPNSASGGGIPTVDPAAVLGLDPGKKD